MNESLCAELGAIRRQTRLALPEDDTYLYRLGAALYGFASITSFMIEIIRRLDSSQDWIALNRLEAGKVCRKFDAALSKARAEGTYVEEAGTEALRLIRELNDARSDFVHAYPITSRQDVQILHRRPKIGESFEVSKEFLDRFISRLHDASSKLYQVRDVLDRSEEAQGGGSE